MKKEERKIRDEVEKGNTETLISMPFSRIPMSQWLEWNEDCKKNFQGMRWIKTYTDHLKAKNSEENEAIWRKIAELESKISILDKQPEEKKEGVITLGGDEHE